MRLSLWDPERICIMQDGDVVEFRFNV